MAQDNEPKYRSDSTTTERTLALLKGGKTAEALASLTEGDPKTAAQRLVDVQCDINNVGHEPFLSAELGLAGARWCVERDLNLPAAMMLHNLTAFFMPNWDEGVDLKAIPILIPAARWQVDLRRKLPDTGSLIWALWDWGMAELASGNLDSAIMHLEEGAAMAHHEKDADAEAWCRLFIGKTDLKKGMSDRDSALSAMKDAAAIIKKVGEDWEREEVSKILKSVGISGD